MTCNQMLRHITKAKALALHSVSMIVHAKPGPAQTKSTLRRLPSLILTTHGQARTLYTARGGTSTKAHGPNGTSNTTEPRGDTNVSQASIGQQDEFWRHTRIWADTPTKDFMSYQWSIANTVQGDVKLFRFLNAVLPANIPIDETGSETQTRDEFIGDVFDGVKASTMAIRITPYILSRINWQDPRHDPVFRQFIHLKSAMIPDHPKGELDSLHEEADSPAKGLVHRYPDKALFLATSVCPVYCSYCTRARAVGPDTRTVTKAGIKGGRKRWDDDLSYVASQPSLSDIVVSGGDSYYLTPGQVVEIGERLIAMPNIRRFRFASKGLAVAPMRILDASDGWADALIHVSELARKAGKGMAFHTHFNHPNEISWITRLAAQKLLDKGVTVRNQTVLLRGVNDDVETMSKLIRELADINIIPYYVYQCDMVEKVEHLRTPLQTILDLEAQIRGSIAGFMTPQFVVDLPGGGGKRLACSFRNYDRETGVSTFLAPAVKGRGKVDRVYEYYDPIQWPPRGGLEEGLDEKDGGQGMAKVARCSDQVLDAGDGDKLHEPAGSDPDHADKAV